MVEAEVGQRIVDLVKALYADWGDEVMGFSERGEGAVAGEGGRGEDGGVGGC